MGNKARVHAIEAVADLKPAMIKFQEECSAALMGAESDAGRMELRLRTERLPYWKKQIRVRQDELLRAKSELIAKQATKDGDQRSSVEERKAVEKAKRRVEEAQQKYETTRGWLRRLEQEAIKYQSGVQPLKTFLSTEAVRSIAELERMVAALEAYAALTAKPAEGGKKGGRS